MNIKSSEIEARAADVRRRCDIYNAWAKQYARGGYIVIPADAIAPVQLTNDERSFLEVFEFCREVPAAYFLYIDEETASATTWTGDTLGAVAFGRTWRDNFGGTRQSIKVHAINGRRYAGTYYKSSGNFARIRLCK